MDNSKSIDVLNTLIQINNDRIEGYETASNETKDADLKTLFAQFIQTSQKFKQELTKEVHTLQGTPTESTHLTGKIHRVWMDIKSAFTGQDRQSILSSCEYGDSAAVETYQDILSDQLEHMSNQQTSTIRDQSLLITDEYERIKNLTQIPITTE